MIWMLRVSLIRYWCVYIWVDIVLLAAASCRVCTREWLTFIPLVWPDCIPVLLLPLERDSELLRERESVLRLRERRWLDGASFDNERGSTSKEGEPNPDKKNTPVQSPVSLGEDLQWWPDKVFGKSFILLSRFLTNAPLHWRVSVLFILIFVGLLKEATLLKCSSVFCLQADPQSIFQSMAQVMYHVSSGATACCVVCWSESEKLGWLS